MSDPVIGFGLNTASIKAGDLDALSAALAENDAIGCTAVELTARRLDCLIGGRIVEPRAAAIAERLGRFEAKPTLHADHALNFMNLPQLARHRALAEATVVLASRLGATSMVVHSGRAPANVWLDAKDHLRATERDELKRLGDKAAELGVRLAVENLIADPRGGAVHYGADPRALADQLAQIDHPAVGGCLDFGHAFLSASVLGFDYLEAITAFSEQVWHLHLHDNFGHPDFRTLDDEGSRAALGVGDLHLPIGWGAIPWADVLPAMRFRPETYAMIELRGRYQAFNREVARTAQAFADGWNGRTDTQTALEAMEGWRAN